MMLCNIREVSGNFMENRIQNIHFMRWCKTAYCNSIFYNKHCYTFVSQFLNRCYKESAQQRNAHSLLRRLAACSIWLLQFSLLSTHSCRYFTLGSSFKAEQVQLFQLLPYGCKGQVALKLYKDIRKKKACFLLTDINIFIVRSP